MFASIPPQLLKRPRFEAFAETRFGRQLPLELLKQIEKAALQYDNYIYDKVGEILTKSYLSALNSRRDSDRINSLARSFNDFPSLIANAAVFKFLDSRLKPSPDDGFFIRKTLDFVVSALLNASLIWPSAEFDQEIPITDAERLTLAKYVLSIPTAYDIWLKLLKTNAEAIGRLISEIELANELLLNDATDLEGLASGLNNGVEDVLYIDRIKEKLGYANEGDTVSLWIVPLLSDITNGAFVEPGYVQHQDLLGVVLEQSELLRKRVLEELIALYQDKVEPRHQYKIKELIYDPAKFHARFQEKSEKYRSEYPFCWKSMPEYPIKRYTCTG